MKDYKKMDPVCGFTILLEYGVNFDDLTINTPRYPQSGSFLRIYAGMKAFFGWLLAGPGNQHKFHLQQSAASRAHPMVTPGGNCTGSTPGRREIH